MRIVRGAVLVIVLGCNPQPVRMPGYYPRPPPSYAQPQPATAPRVRDDLPPLRLAGMWTYGNFDAPFYDPASGVWTQAKSNAGIFIATEGGKYELGHVAVAHEGNCKRSSYEWQQGGFEIVGNVITLRPAQSRARVDDGCDPSKSTDTGQRSSPTSFSVQLADDTLTLYFPSGLPFKGPYYRVP